jgi:hypothetical protein
MKLNQLFEAATDTVAVIFGRFNPPHKGHKAAWELMRKDSSNWFVGTNASTQGPKDPLPYDVKIEAMKAIDPEVEGHLMSSQSWLTMISELYEKFPKAKLIVYTDEEWVIKAINQYNGIEGKAHGFYDFTGIEHKPTPRVSSATQLRDAVAANDRTAFTKAAGIDADTEIAGKAYFDLVAEYLMPHVAKANEKAAKKKKAESLEEAPIEMDPGDPMDPMIYGHEKANPGKLKYRMARAAGQLKDLASRVDGASPSEWQTMARQFEELKMNMEQIRHALQELAKRRSKGGKSSRGIDPHIDTREDAAGVGIITKQNTTKDVNKGTLRKMMKGYRLI